VRNCGILGCEPRYRAIAVPKLQVKLAKVELCFQFGSLVVHAAEVDASDEFATATYDVKSVMLHGMPIG
jgi:hypothetical protein